jgi:hypothetical protein
MIRIGTAYPRFRKGIAVTRAVVLVIIVVLLTLAVLGILGMIFVALAASTPYRLLPALLTGVISALIWTGVLYLASELICGGLEVLVDLGDQTLDHTIEKDVAEQSQSDYPAEVLPHDHVEVPAVMEPAPVIPRSEAPVRPASTPSAPGSIPHRPDGSIDNDETAANWLLQLAKKHMRNGNKPEAMRCLREIVSRYGSTGAAGAARRSLGWVSS